jgi:uncharacterized protein (TIGR02466 family)
VNLETIFCSFLVSDFLEVPSNFENSCYNLVKQENQRRNDLITQTSFLDLEDKTFKSLLSFVEEKFNILHRELGLTQSVNQIISEYWININLNEKISFPHSHPNRIFSAVYYIKADKNCGDLVFMNPNKVVCQNISDDCIENYNFYNATHWKVTPQPGLLIIFPSWLEHYVMTNNSNNDRISVAFNSKMIYR